MIRVPPVVERANPVAREDVEGEPGDLEVAQRSLPKLVGLFPGSSDREQAAMGDHHALRPPGGAGREDDVGEVVGVYSHRQIFGTLAVDGIAVCVQVDDRRPGSRRTAKPTAVHDHDGYARSVQHSLRPRHGSDGSMGTYAAPALSTPRTATIRLIGESRTRPTRASGRAPCERR